MFVVHRDHPYDLFDFALPDGDILLITESDANEIQHVMDFVACASRQILQRRLVARITRNKAKLCVTLAQRDRTYASVR